MCVCVCVCACACACVCVCVCVSVCDNDLVVNRVETQCAFSSMAIYWTRGLLFPIVHVVLWRRLLHYGSPPRRHYYLSNRDTSSGPNSIEACTQHQDISLIGTHLQVLTPLKPVHNTRISL